MNRGDVTRRLMREQGEGEGKEGTGGGGSGDGKENEEGKKTGFVEWDGKMLTGEEVKIELERAQELVRGANRKFQEAAELRKEALGGKEAGEAQRKLEDLKKVNEGDVDACKRLLEDGTLKQLGLNEQVLTYLENASEGEKGEGRGKPPKQKIEWEDLPEEARGEIEEFRKKKNEELRETVLKKASDFLDKDPVVGDIIRREEGVRKRVLREVEDSLRRRAQEAYSIGDYAWKPTTPGVLQAVSQEVRTYLKDLGWLGDTDEAGEDGKSTTGRAHPSVGRAGSGPIGKLHQVEEPGERPSSRKPADYSAWLARKVNEAMTKPE